VKPEQLIRREIRSIDIASAARIGLVLSLSIWGIVLVGLVALYVLGLVSGGLGGVEGLIASLGFTGFRFTILPFIAAFVMVAILASAVTALLAAIVALLYNHVTPLTGGLSVRTRERR
jgi:hypothetical protein